MRDDHRVFALELLFSLNALNVGGQLDREHCQVSTRLGRFTMVVAQFINTYDEHTMPPKSSWHAAHDYAFAKLERHE